MVSRRAPLPSQWVIGYLEMDPGTNWSLGNGVKLSNYTPEKLLNTSRGNV